MAVEHPSIPPAFSQEPTTNIAWNITPLAALDLYRSENPWLADSTAANYRLHLRTFEQTLGAVLPEPILLGRIDAGTIETYRTARMRAGIPAARINRELKVLSILMRWSGLWSRIKWPAPLEEPAPAPSASAPAETASAAAPAAFSPLTGLTGPEFASLAFRSAAPIWLQDRRGAISPRSFADYGQHITQLNKFFGDLRLSEIHIGHLREYQRIRQGEIGPSRLNHECNMVLQVLGRADLRKQVEAYYEPLKLPRTSGRGIVLEQEEEEYLFEIARSDTRWMVAYFTALLTANTTAGPGELRLLQRRDVDMEKRLLFVREGAKNRQRERPIPLNDDAAWAMQKLLERAHEQGASKPTHYLFPHRARVKGDGWDPTRPMFTWKTAWRALRKKVAKRYPRLSKLRHYDLRHHAITRLLENPDVSERVVIEVAGHVGRKMLDTYSHVRARFKKEALDSLCRPQPPAAPAQPSPPPDPSQADQLAALVSLIQKAAAHGETQRDAEPTRPKVIEMPANGARVITMPRR